MSVEITPQDFPEIRWQGHWIWVPEEPISVTGSISASASINSQAPETHGLFRKSVYLEQVPDRVPARITADSRYALFVNGQEVFRGPIRSQPRRLYYDLFDLAPYLQAGEKYLGGVRQILRHAQILLDASFTKPDAWHDGYFGLRGQFGVQDRGWLVSDASWKAKKSDAWSSDRRNDSDDPVGGGVPIEVFDARHFPHDWRDASFDDSGWGAAQVVPAKHIGGFAQTQPPTDPYGPLYPRPIAKLSGQVCTPAVVTVETLDGQVDTSISIPNKRVRAAVASTPNAPQQLRSCPSQ